jgi:hopanoid biosynthesis associated protein HpnK
MERPDAAPCRRLIVNADDFGRSRSINAAVVQAHREGILTTASLMVTGSAAAEAVELARQNPRLGVGLHLTLLMGRAALPPERIPGLADAAGKFANNPVSVGMRYFFRPELEEQIEAEMDAQFALFHRTGLELDHVNGHLHLHLHPVVFRLLMKHATRWGVRRIRLTRDAFWLNARIARGEWLYRTSHAVIFQALSLWARGEVVKRGLKHTPRVFGLLQNGRVDEAYLLKLLPELPSGDSELFSHPGLDEFPREAAALVSPAVKAAVQRLGIELVRYQDL